MTVNPFFMALMPISHVASWWLVLRNNTDTNDLCAAVAKIAAFYCAWALYKVLGQGDKQEKGHFSMGLMALACTFGKSQPYILLMANALVIVNFAIVIPFFINRGVPGIVKMIHKEINTLTMTWGYTFLAYLVGNVVLWGYIFKTIWSLAIAS